MKGSLILIMWSIGIVVVCEFLYGLGLIPQMSVWGMVWMLIIQFVMWLLACIWRMLATHYTIQRRKS